MDNKKKRYAYATCVDCGKSFPKKKDGQERCDECSGEVQEIYA